MAAAKGKVQIPEITKLRQQAEDLLCSGVSMLNGNDHQGEYDVQRLLHELQVHQIELEMQNEELRQINADLSASEERYRSIVDTNPDFIDRYLPGGILTYVNPVLVRFTGVDADDLLGKSYFPFIHEDDLQVLIPLIASIRRDNPTVEIENRTILPDGRLCWNRWTHSGIFDDRGNIIEYQAVGKDITDRKRMEIELAEKRLRLQYIIKGSNAGTWEWNVQTGETRFNERWAEMLGYTLEEISPTSLETWMKMVHPESFKKSFNLLQRHFSGELAYYECEAQLRHKNGNWIWVLDRGKIVTWTEDGKPLLMMGAHQDITEQKLAEQELRRYTKELEDANTALRVFMDRRERDQKILEEKLQLNIDELVVPYLKKLSETTLDSRQNKYLTVLESNLNTIVSPYMLNLSAAYKNLTPQEIQITNLIRQGKNTKDIAELLNTSAHTVGTHRNNIRKKLKLRNSKSNLRSHLLTLE